MGRARISRTIWKKNGQGKYSRTEAYQSIKWEILKLLLAFFNKACYSWGRTDRKRMSYKGIGFRNRKGEMWYEYQ